MEQPKGFIDANRPSWVCEILCSLYGLKQSPREWNKTLHKFLILQNLTQLSHDLSLYFKHINQELVGLIVIHVDDLSITGTDDFISNISKALRNRSCFEISTHEPLSHFLYLQIECESSTTASISQSHYIEDLVEKFLPSNFKLCKTPTTETFKLLVPNSNSEITKSPYSSLIGGLLWVAQCSRPDISFPVNRLSQFLQNPHNDHWEAALLILSYLNKTKVRMFWSLQTGI